MAVEPDWSPQPVSVEAFAAAMARLEPFEPQPLLAVAVSGGPDSMALAMLASDWARQRGGSVHAILIDHGLRAESEDEVRIASDALSARGIETTIEKLSGPAPRNGKPAWARQERYKSLMMTTHRLGALHLLTGHHRDDQAETFILNLERGSGVKGLSGMAANRGVGSARIIRPLLNFSKAQLHSTALMYGLPVAHDPSNQDFRYSRTRVRAQLDNLEIRRLADTSARLANEDIALELAVSNLAANALTITPLGEATITMKKMAEAPAVIALRLFTRIAHAIGGRETPPRQERAEAALNQIISKTKSKLTLGSAIITRVEDRLNFRKELGKNPLPEITSPGHWDGRFDVAVYPFWPENCVVRGLGYEGLRQLESSTAKNRIYRSTPRSVLAAAPALWQGKQLLIGPSLAGEFMGIDQTYLQVSFRPRRPIAPC